MSGFCRSAYVPVKSNETEFIHLLSISECDSDPYLLRVIKSDSKRDRRDCVYYDFMFMPDRLTKDISVFLNGGIRCSWIDPLPPISGIQINSRPSFDLGRPRSLNVANLFLPQSLNRVL
jgi:hypothetical protein